MYVKQHSIRTFVKSVTEPDLFKVHQSRKLTY